MFRGGVRGANTKGKKNKMNTETFRYAMNLNDGRIVFFNEQVAMQTAYAAIPDDIAVAVDKGEIDWRKVAELIHKKRNNDPSFSWEAFDRLRDRQNIRKAKFDPVEPERASDALPDTVPQTEISMDELKGGKTVAVDNVSRSDSAIPVEKPKARTGAQRVVT